MKKMLSIFFTVLLTLSVSAHSDQKEPGLDSLFRSLLDAETTPIEAHEITSKIWQLWLRADDAESQELMDSGIRKMSEFALDEAVDIFSELIRINPDFAEAWNKRATVYYMMGKFDLSTADVVETLRLEPRHFGALSGQGLIHLQSEREQAAVDWFKRALRVNPFMQNIQNSVDQLEKELKARVI
ncbi:MAG: hypothetical protein KTR18_03755 [Acidiferrobacterales bacterium]|nr:hypothetical protein [Acidiferrobacterales bacterium]